MARGTTGEGGSSEDFRRPPLSEARWLRGGGQGQAGRSQAEEPREHEKGKAHGRTEPPTPSQGVKNSRRKGKPAPAPGGRGPTPARTSREAGSRTAMAARERALSLQTLSGLAQGYTRHVHADAV